MFVCLEVEVEEEIEEITTFVREIFYEVLCYFQILRFLYQTL